MLRNDPLAACWSALVAECARDPRLTRPRLRRELGEYFDALLAGNTSMNEDTTAQGHVETVLLLAFRFRDRGPAPVAPVPIVPAPPAAPKRRPHRKKKPGAPAPPGGTRRVDPPWPYKKPHPPSVDGTIEDVPREELGRGDPRAVDPDFDQEEADQVNDLDAKGNPRKGWRERERERTRTHGDWRPDPKP